MAKYTLKINKVTNERSVVINKTGEVIVESIDPVKYNELRKKAINNLKSKQRNDVYESLGLTKVRGAVSGKVYWE